MNCLKCGINISDSLEEGVNGSDYYECPECRIGYNVITTILDKEEED